MTIYQKNTDRIREHLREFILAKLRDSGMQTVSQLVQATVAAFHSKFVERPLDIACDVLIVLHDLRDSGEIVGSPIESTAAEVSGYAYRLKGREEIADEPTAADDYTIERSGDEDEAE